MGPGEKEHRPKPGDQSHRVAVPAVGAGGVDLLPGEAQPGAKKLEGRNAAEDLRLHPRLPEKGQQSLGPAVKPGVSGEEDGGPFCRPLLEDPQDLGGGNGFPAEGTGVQKGLQQPLRPNQKLRFSDGLPGLPGKERRVSRAHADQRNLHNYSSFDKIPRISSRV